MANTFELISAVTVGSGGAASIDFTSIPATFTDLCIEISVRDTSAGGAWGSGKITFNSSGSGYSGRNAYGIGNSTGSDSYSFSGAGIYFPTEASPATASTFNNCSVYIPNYTSANYKSASLDSVTENNNVSAIAHFNAVLWSNTAAITQITLAPASGTFVQYSTAYLYGVKNA